MKGIYFLINTKDNKLYIGRYRSVAGRIKQHLAALKEGTHKNQYLQEAFNQDGEDSFGFGVLEECSGEVYAEREQHWLDSFDDLYNIIPRATWGGCWTEEWARKIGDATKGRAATQHQREVASKTHKGKVISKEHRQRISEFMTGRPSPNKGKVTPEETRKKLSEAGKRRWARERDK